MLGSLALRLTFRVIAVYSMSFLFFFFPPIKGTRFSTWTPVLWYQKWRNCECSRTEREREVRERNFTQGIPEIVFDRSAQVLNVAYVSFMKLSNCCCPITLDVSSYCRLLRGELDKIGCKITPSAEYDLMHISLSEHIDVSSLSTKK